MTSDRRPPWREILTTAADQQHTAALTWQECQAILDAFAEADALADEWAGHADLFEGWPTVIDSRRAAKRIRAALGWPE